MAACAGLWQRIRTDYNGLDAPIEEFGDIEAWRPEASMPGCNDGWLAGSAGWLAGWAADRSENVPTLATIYRLAGRLVGSLGW